MDRAPKNMVWLSSFVSLTHHVITVKKLLRLCGESAYIVRACGVSRAWRPSFQEFT